MRNPTFIAVGLAILAQGTLARQVPDLNAGNSEHWKGLIMPTEADLAFESIPWLPTLESGLRAADAQQKPLLLWVMNGHPLGCT